MSDTPTVTAATTRIVIVSGQEYQVPTTATEAELRQHLATMFPDITNASLQKGKRTVDGTIYETWEFVKRAGTKGASGAALAALLAQTPRLPSPNFGPKARHLLAMYRNANATIGECVDGDLAAIVNAMPNSSQIRSGGDLCNLTDMLPAAPGSDTTGW